jgi:hypothetical protein
VNAYQGGSVTSIFDPSDPCDDPHFGGRPPVLDEEKRRKIIAMLANGSSRRVAANYVGCAPSTITRAILRDGEFAAAVAQAEQNTEIDALRHIRNAARNNRYWRAAAWLLERRNPQDFAKRPPHAFTDDQIVQLFLKVTSSFIAKMSDDDFDQAFEQLDALVREIRIDPKKADVPYSSQLPAPKWPAWGYAKADPPDEGSFATDPPNSLSDFDEDESSQVYVVEAVQIVADPSSQTAH